MVRLTKANSKKELSLAAVSLRNLSQTEPLVAKLLVFKKDCSSNLQIILHSSLLPMLMTY